MSFQVSCPHCAKPYLMPESRIGKTFACRRCATTFTVGNGDTPVREEVAPLPDVLPADPTALTDRLIPRPAYASASSRPAPRPTIPTATPGGIRQLPRKPESADSTSIWLILGGVAVSLVLLLGIGVTAYLVVKNLDNKPTDNVPFVFAPPPQQPGPFGFGAGGNPNPMAPNQGIPFPQINVPVIPPPVFDDPNAPPQNLDDAIKGLRDFNIFRRGAALQWLENAPVDEGRRLDVSRALEALLRDFDISKKTSAVKLLATWGTKNSTPALIRAMDDLTSPNPEIMRTLLVLKDPRAVAPIAAKLTSFNPADRDAALETLNAWGADAGPAILKVVNTIRDQEQREALMKSLAKFGTKPEAIITQAITDVGSNNGDVQRNGLEMLAKMDVVEDQRASVAKAVGRLTQHTSFQVRILATDTLTIWATSDSIPYLAKMLDDIFYKDKDKIYDAFRKLKNEKVIPVVVARLGRPGFLGPELEQIRKILIDAGPKAENALIELLQKSTPRQNPNGRADVWSILGDVGTKDKLTELTKISDAEFFPNAKQNAKAALEKIKARENP